jgi:hypothetical protein
MADLTIFDLRHPARLIPDRYRSSRSTAFEYYQCIVQNGLPPNNDDNETVLTIPDCVGQGPDPLLIGRMDIESFESSACY